MEKPMTGCMGVVVNLFDLGSNASGNKLLTEKAHNDRSQPSTDQLAAKKATDPVYSLTTKKLGTRDLKINIFNKKSSITPMKMLIAQEMLKEPNSRKKSPSVVARLMGLDAFPPQNQIQNFEGSLSASYDQNKSTKFETSPRNRPNKDDFTEEVHSSHLFPQETQYCKDIYEVQPHSDKVVTMNMKDRVFRKTKQKEDINERMALVRQKFMEAKRLSMDEELRHSKEFQDALDVLSSNREVFLKFLQEPNSLLSNYLFELQYVPIPVESKRITVLRPANAAEMNEEKTSKFHLSKETNEWDKNSSGRSGFNVHLKRHNTNQPTRIVVLKPSPGKVAEVKSLSSPTSPRRSQKGACDCKEGYRAVKTKESREIGKDTNSQMRRKMSRSYGDDSLMSSDLSKGYVGDQSSPNKSDTEDALEDNLSDSEILTPNSKHSWDFIRKYESPISSRSFSRASHSSESSVIREAKKRLSERWALMAMNGNSEEIRQNNKSASTLGDMLSLPEAKVPTQSDKEVKNDGKNICYSKSCGGEQEMELLSSGMSNGENMDKTMDGFPGNLERSVSAPVSSRAYEIAKPDVDAPCLEHKISNHKGSTKSKNAKLSIKGKVSSFFFPKNKKQNKDGQSSTFSSQDCLQLDRISDTSQVLISDKFDDISPCAITRIGSEGIIVKLSELNTKPLSTRHESLACEGSLFLEKTGATEQLHDNREQPSPVSVLDALLDEEVSTPRSGGKAEMDQTSHLRLLKSCDATTKSPLIESVSRSLMWDDGILEMPSSVSSGICTVRSEVAHEQDLFTYVRSLFAAADLENETSNTVFHKWHSIESPLDPSLAEKCAVVDVDEQAKRKQKRCDRKLVFDSVNEALLEVVGFTREARECDLISSKITRKSVYVIEEVWDLIKQWSFSESKISCGESDDGLIVEKVVKREIVGKGWDDLTRSEVEKAGREIEKFILQEIIEEVLEELVH